MTVNRKMRSRKNKRTFKRNGMSRKTQKVMKGGSDPPRFRPPPTTTPRLQSEQPKLEPKLEIYEDPRQFQNGALKHSKSLTPQKSSFVSKISKLFRRDKALPLEQQIKMEANAAAASVERRKSMLLPEVPVPLKMTHEELVKAKEKVKQEQEEQEYKAREISNREGFAYSDYKNFFQNLKTSLQLGNTTHSELKGRVVDIDKINKYLQNLNYDNTQKLDPETYNIMQTLYSKYGNQKINPMQKIGITQPTYVDMTSPHYMNLAEAKEVKDPDLAPNLQKYLLGRGIAMNTEGPTVNRTKKQIHLPGSSLNTNNFSKAFATGSTKRTKENRLKEYETQRQQNIAKFNLLKGLSTQINNKGIQFNFGDGLKSIGNINPDEFLGKGDINFISETYEPYIRNKLLTQLKDKNSFRYNELMGSHKNTKINKLETKAIPIENIAKALKSSNNGALKNNRTNMAKKLRAILNAHKTNGTSSSALAPPAPPAPPALSSLGNDIKSGKARLRSSTSTRAISTGNPRNALLADIQAGRQLRKTSNLASSTQKPQKTASADNSLSARLLARLLIMRKGITGANENETKTNDNTNW